MPETQEESTKAIDINTLANLLYEGEGVDEDVNEGVNAASGFRDRVGSLEERAEEGPNPIHTRSTKKWRRSRILPEDITLH